MPANDMRNGEVVIDVEGLTKSFDGKVVVRNLSMQVKRGQIYGFLGPNGSGKTTTLRMLCGLLTPDSGRGTAMGFDIRTDNEEIKRHVGYMTQRFSLYQDLSILENLEFVARVRFISAQAEFTPPIIYSQEERARLVFRVEAVPERPADLRVGQPVTVVLQPAASQSHARK